MRAFCSVTCQRITNRSCGNFCYAALRKNPHNSNVINHKSIMKLSTISFLVILAVMPFLSFALSNWYTNEIRQIHNDYPYNEITRIIKNINSIDKVKEVYITSLENERKTTKDSVDTHQEFTEILLYFAIGNAIFLFFLYRVLSNKVYNKSLNLTGANNAPPN